MKISLILPVYNVEQYVAQCLVSCINQDIPKTDYEIIVVNDGTKDNSLAIVEEIAKTNNNIIVVSQKNAGLSAARNKGLSFAKGDYIWFIDTDDKIKENCLGSVLKKLYSEELDALGISAVRVIDGKPIEKIYSYRKPDTNTGKEFLRQKLWLCGAQFTIYKRQFLLDNNLSFMKGVYHEDNEFTPRAYFFAEKVGVLCDILYFFTHNPNSITSLVNPKKSYDCVDVAKSLSTFNTKYVDDDLTVSFHNQIALLINNALYNILRSDDKDVQAAFNAYLYQNRNLFTSLVQSSILKYKLEGVLFKLFPRKSLLVYKLLQKRNS